MIADFLRLLFQPGDVFEVRAPKCLSRRGSTFTSTLSGYYNYEHIDAAARDVAGVDRAGLAPGIYCTINPVQPSLLARCVNRMQMKAQATTTDEQIVRRRWILVDIDPVRPADVSSTDSELALAKAKAAEVWKYLEESGWPEPIVAASGNGYHMLYRVDLATKDDGLVQRILNALAERFDDDAVKIDTGTYNPARISKIVGTMARKGDDLRGVPGIEDRPHRRMELVRTPVSIHNVPQSCLDALGGTPVPLLSGRGIDNESPFGDPENLRAWLESKGVEVRGVRVASDGRAFINLARCPVNPSIEATGNSDISVILDPSGKVGYANQHNRGRGYTWADLRRAIDPEYGKPEVFVIDPAFTVKGSRAGQVEAKPIECVGIPTALLNPGGFMGEVIRYNMATCKWQQPALALAGAIALQATIAGRKIRDHHRNMTCLFVVGLGPSGSGKEHSRKINKRIISEAGLAGKVEGADEIASDSGLMSVLEDNPSALFQIDEFGRFLRDTMGPGRNQYMANIVSLLMKMFSSEGEEFLGKAYADKEKNKKIFGPCPVVYGTTVAENFFGSMDSDSLSDGFAARLLVFDGDPDPPRGLARDEDPPSNIVEVMKYWYSADKLGLDNGRRMKAELVESTTTAREAMIVYGNDVRENRMKGKGVDHATSSIWARAEEKACRLAMIHAASLCPDKVRVDVESVEWACGVTDYCTMKMLELAGKWVSESRTHQHIQRILRIMESAGGVIGRTELGRKAQSIPPRERSEIINHLIETEQIAVENRQTDSGRNATVYRLRG